MFPDLGAAAGRGAAEGCQGGREALAEELDKKKKYIAWAICVLQKVTAEHSPFRSEVNSGHSRAGGVFFPSEEKGGKRTLSSSC